MTMVRSRLVSLDIINQSSAPYNLLKGDDSEIDCDDFSQSLLLIYKKLPSPQKAGHKLKIPSNLKMGLFMKAITRFHK